jgi:hypothetical protein
VQGKASKEIRAIITETLGNMHHRMKQSKTGWPSLIKRGDFSSCDAPCPGSPKPVTSEIIDQIHELMLEDRRQDFG